jgi:hypothetical protein
MCKPIKKEEVLYMYVKEAHTWLFFSPIYVYENIQMYNRHKISYIKECDLSKSSVFRPKYVVWSLEYCLYKWIEILTQ